MTNVNLPKSGMGIDEATVIRWLKQVGDQVEAGEPLVEIETAKSTLEIEAPASGVLTEILVQEGQDVPVNTTLAIID